MSKDKKNKFIDKAKKQFEQKAQKTAGNSEKVLSLADKAEEKAHKNNISKTFSEAWEYLKTFFALLKAYANSPEC